MSRALGLDEPAPTVWGAGANAEDPLRPCGLKASGAHSHATTLPELPPCPLLRIARRCLRGPARSPNARATKTKKKKMKKIQNAKPFMLILRYCR